jgi:SSS family solute:Na+ symporter
VLLVVSWCTAVPPGEKISGLAYGTTQPEDRLQSQASWNRYDLLLSLLVVVFIVAIFLYFSPLGVG